jgi:hypothetical protein
MRESERCVCGLPEGNRITQNLQPFQLLDVRTLRSILTLLGVQPVLGLLQGLEEGILLGGGDVRCVAVFAFGSVVVDVFFQRVFTVLYSRIFE